MGDVRHTHGQRSSSMSFAWRWKHENFRLILLSAIISIAMTFMFLVLLYGTTEKSVSLVVNGQETVVKTKKWALQDLLEEKSITIGPYDEVSVPLNAGIKDGDRIEINHAVKLTVKADGKLQTLYTTKETVGEAIDELNIKIRESDKVTPALTAPLTGVSSVTVVRVDTHVSQAERSVPFTIIKKEDPTLEKGKEKLVQSGQEGVVVEQIEKVYEDGQLVSKKIVSKVVEQPAVNKIVAVGTKKTTPNVTTLAATSVTKGGVTFKPKKVLNNVTLTAYTADTESTGKDESHPQYGITASGTKVEEGRTIAVDPDVIPLGWWVYIEGIGFRRAEDTGGAITGNKIDIYFDSSSYAVKFGKKKGYTVYVLGPTKPSAS
ncbi:ubiquitin-like domain-containing protein [Paenibacillus thailandensis]|uniref:Ubiquitin-like domain-containing protein n=1 Tax=Paenibacillus thailandensis TaxID=393250 RepID=A0ABW5R2R9_9BACL